MISLLAAFLAQPTLAAPVDAGRVTVELVAQDNAVAPGATVYVAVVQTMDRGWHTYWRNPGESGEATTIAWTLPDGWRAGEIVWPTPARLFTGAADNQIINYVYSDQSMLPVPISVPADARPGTTVSLRAVVSYLVCADICVPETATVTLFVPIAASPQGPDPLWGAQIAQALVQAPKPSGLTASFQSQGGTLVMGITGRSLSGVDLTGADFFAYDGALISPRAPTRMERGAQGLSFGLTPEASFAAATPPASLGGILVTTAGAFEVTAHPGPISADARGGGNIRPAATPTVATTAAVLALNMLLAFIGGLILNLMPCVFPILSMKAASLAGHGEDVQGARRQGLWFMAGVVTTFLAWP